MLKKLLLSIVFFITLTTQAQYTSIPDPNFEQRLIERGFDFGPIDGKVLTATVRAITFLDAGHANISDLTGIEDFVSLQYFWCDQNNLTTLDFSKNIALTNLECQINKLTSLNITKNVNLEVIWCHENKLTFVDFSNNLKLQTIECDTNEMTSIDLSKNINLKTLITSRNPLNTLDVSKNINLVQIYCSSNRLRSLDISNNTKLVYFRCDTNLITELDASKNINLQQFSCKENLLTSLNLKNGFNTNFDVRYFTTFVQNPNLRCISVDKASYSNTNWASIKDPTASYTDIIDAAPAINSPLSFCIQENKTLNDISIQTGLNLKWYIAIAGGNLLPSNTVLTEGSKYFASQLVNGCESQRTEILVNIHQTLSPDGNQNQSFCITENASLNNIVINGTSIKWYDSAINGKMLPNNTLLENAKNYYASQTLNGCESTNRLKITVTIISNLQTNNYDEYVCDDLNDGAQNINLDDYHNYIIANPENYNFTVYKTFNGADSQLTSDQINNSKNYNLILGENFFYFRVASGSCYKIAVLKLTLINSPTITIQSKYFLCNGKSIYIQADLGYDEYLWSDGRTNSLVSFNKIGNYSLEVVKINNGLKCTSKKEFEIIAAESPTIKNINTEELDNDLTKITVQTNNSGQFEYSIDGENYQTSNQIIGEFPGKQIVYVRDINGCGTDFGYAFSIKYPKFFTPNSDGFNDTWKLLFTNEEPYLSAKIFDRFGRLLKVLKNSNDSWDGSFNNNLLLADDYWFSVELSNGKLHKGHFSLIR